MSDQLDKAGVWGFDETSVVGNVGRDIVEAGGSAAIAAATGGNVGAAAASAIAGNVAVGMVGQDIANAAVVIAGKDNEKFATGLTNIGANIIATAAGEGIGAPVGGSVGAANGASIASSINEYNYNFSEAAGKLVQNAIKGPSTVGVIGAVVGGVAGSLEGGVGAIPGAAAGYRAGSTLEAIYNAIYNAITGLEITSKPSDSVSQSNSNADSAQSKPDSSNANSGSSGVAAPPPDGNEPPDDHNDDKNNQTGSTQTSQGDNPLAPTDAAQNTATIPQKAEDVLQQVEQKGSPMPGYKGGGKFGNDPLPGAQKLPTQDANGNPITYQEWDTDLAVKGQRRNSERIVTGSDGSAYYTNDHYHTFNKMRNYAPRIKK